jgi:ATP adenylyltransferase
MHPLPEWFIGKSTRDCGTGKHGRLPISILTNCAAPSTAAALVESSCMKNLWAPWRMSYLRGESEAKGGCLFCRTLEEAQSDESNLVLHRGAHVLAMLNKYPYSNGHILLVPAEHMPSLEDLPAEVMSELAALSQTALRVLRSAYSPEGFNVGVNIGAAGGAGVPEHVHMHVLPRWAGDTNFMTTVAEMRIVPEELAVTYRRLRDLMTELRLKGDLGREA